MTEAYRRKLVYQNKSVAEAYSGKRFSSPRGRRENELTRNGLAHALDAIGGTKSILDLPCGAGRFTGFFHERGYEYFGADVSMEMIMVLTAERQKDGQTPSLVRCDAEHLPFRDNAVDCVVSIRFLNHLPRLVRAKVLTEMRRVARRSLIVESRILKFFGPFVRLKVLGRRLLRRNVTKYDLNRAIVEAGWVERSKVPVGYKRRYIGIYEKI